MTNSSEFTSRGIVITTTRAEVPGRTTAHVHGVVVGDGATPSEAVGTLEEMAKVYEANAVIDVRLIMHGVADGAKNTIRYCAYGTAIALGPN